MKYYYDLHIHSDLSPCAESEMTPNNIVNMAILKNLDIIAVTDHNSACNLKAIEKIALAKKILLIPAIEVESKEGVHLLCYFHTVEIAIEFSKIIYNSLPEIKVNKIFGEQNIIDSNDEIVGNVDKLLISSSMYSINEIFERVNLYKGIMICAHIFRKSNGVLSSLGFLPNDMSIKTLEINTENKLKKEYENKYNCICNSDAHRLIDIHESIYSMDLESKTIESVIKWLMGVEK